MDQQQRFLTHICTRIASDIDLLVDVGALPSQEGEGIKAKLPWDAVSKTAEEISSLGLEYGQSLDSSPTVAEPSDIAPEKKAPEPAKKPNHLRPRQNMYHSESAVQQAAAVQQQAQQNHYNQQQAEQEQQQQQQMQQQQVEEMQHHQQYSQQQQYPQQNQPPALPQRAQPTPPSRPRRKVKALYDYFGQQEGDLSFMKGDVIEVLQEDNAHWSTGKIGENIGLFPTNHVIPFSTTLPQCNVYTSRPSMAAGHYVKQYIKNAPQSIPTAHSSNPNPALNMTSQPQYAVTNEKQGYQHALPQDIPQNVPLPADRPQSVTVQQPQRKFGSGLGNTLLHGGVGGMGFGAGSALVNAIL